MNASAADFDNDLYDRVADDGPGADLWLCRVSERADQVERLREMSRLINTNEQPGHKLGLGSTPREPDVVAAIAGIR